MEKVVVPQYTPPDFTGFAKILNLSWLVGAPILIIIFLIFTVCYIIVSFILLYHWSKYGMKSSGILVAQSLYVIVSAMLLFFTSLTILYC